MGGDGGAGGMVGGRFAVGGDAPTLTLPRRGRGFLGRAGGRGLAVAPVLPVLPVLPWARIMAGLCLPLFPLAES